MVTLLLLLLLLLLLAFVGAMAQQICMPAVPPADSREAFRRAGWI
jgi:hypothetical protein